MANKNFEVKHGLSVGGTERISSAGAGTLTDLTLSGNLTVNGSTTTINSTTLDVDDLNITVAKGAADSAAANGAGLTIEGPTSNASLIWDHGNQYLELNKDLFTASSFIVGTTSTNVGRLTNSSGVFNIEAYTTRQIALGNATNGEHVRIDANGQVGIGEQTPSYKLEVNGTAHVVNTLTAGAIGIPTQGITLNQGFGSGVPTLTTTGTNSTNGRAGAILFNEYGDVNCAAIYSTDGAGGNANYGGLLLATYQSDIRFSTGGLASTKMIVKSDGKVGIGTASPSEELHVTSAVSGDHTRVHVTKTGTAGTAGISFNTTSSSNTWTLFQEDASASKFYFYDGADYVMTLDSANNLVAIGDTTTPITKLHVAGAQNDTYGQLYVYGSGSNQDPQIAMGSSTNGRGFYIDDGDVNRFKIYTGHGKGSTGGAYEFVIDNSGTIESARTYANTTGAYSANVYVHTDGSFNRATSSRRYKTDIVDATKGLDEILQLKPRNYKPKNDRTDSSEPNAEINDPHLDAENRTFAGLIAEEVHDLGLTEYVDYEEDGTTPSGLYYGNMIALLVKGIQEQQTTINDLKSRIETLEG